MPSSCRISSFIRRGLIVESETLLNGEIGLTVRAEAGFAVCPLCSAPSLRIHSRYLRPRDGLAAFGSLRSPSRRHEARRRLHVLAHRWSRKDLAALRRIADAGFGAETGRLRADIA